MGDPPLLAIICIRNPAGLSPHLHIKDCYVSERKALWSGMKLTYGRIKVTLFTNKSQVTSDWFFTVSSRLFSLLRCRTHSEQTICRMLLLLRVTRDFHHYLFAAWTSERRTTYGSTFAHCCHFVHWPSLGNVPAVRISRTNRIKQTADEIASREQELNEWEGNRRRGTRTSEQVQRMGKVKKRRDSRTVWETHIVRLWFDFESVSQKPEANSK